MLCFHDITVIIALCFGYLIAALANYQGLDYVNTQNIQNADPVTFLWVHTFPLGLYGPAVIPLLIAYLVTTVETVGDISAVYEVSELSTESQDYSDSLQGGLTSDSFASILAGLFTTMPNTTFSQNNGVIALTKCASRRAGYAAGCWLLIMGIFSKFAGMCWQCLSNNGLPSLILTSFVFDMKSYQRHHYKHP